MPLYAVRSSHTKELRALYQAEDPRDLAMLIDQHHCDPKPCLEYQRLRVPRTSSLTGDNNGLWLRDLAEEDWRPFEDADCWWTRRGAQEGVPQAVP